MGKPWEILHGDVRRVCKTLEANSFDAVLGDPPYGLSFMGRRWDYSVPSALLWSEVERVIKPGAHAMIFGGSRTFHRTVVAAEDGGLIPRDLMFWFYGSGYPKSHNVSKAIDSDDERAEEAEDWIGFGTALKPSYEPILLARKMLEGTVAENALKWGSGALAIDAGRIGNEAVTINNYKGIDPMGNLGGKSRAGDAFESRESVGRWPSNIIIDEVTGKVLDVMFGDHPGMSGGGKHRKGYGGGMFGGIDSEGTARNDNGGVSRFFYTTKADRYQREAGLEKMKKVPKGVGALRDGGRTATTSANTHPTVKPIDLIRYLASLILPPKRSTPRRILVPFSGVASEMIGCMQAGWDEVVGIEREAEYIAIAKARITGGGVLSGLMDKKMRRRKAR